MTSSKRSRARAAADRRRPRGAGPAAAPAFAAWPPLARVAVALLVAVLAADVARIGFFADDFHFLDIARRVPLLHQLGGQYGIYPWYRPLSRELYFALIALAGPAGIVVAHGLSLACTGLAAWWVRRLGARLAGARVGSIAAALFLTYALTKFLTAWASGFQDLLALLLVLLALDAHASRRGTAAALLAFLAPFAKETGFLVFPLLALQALLFERERRWRDGLPAALACAAAMAIHLAVRATWHTAGSTAVVHRSLPALLGALARVAGGFVGGAPVLAPGALALAALAVAGAAALLAAAPGRAAAGARPAPRATLAFLAGAALLGLAPLVVGQLAGLASAFAYYAFSAAPWLALLLALAIARLPRRAGTLVVLAVVGWDTLALGYRAPDLTTSAAWNFRTWDWPEAVRLSAVAQSLADDLRGQLATRPESLVVLYLDVRRGSYFQTEDGPATRESLRDPTVRGYWVNAPPYGLRPGRFTILAVDRARHLVPFHPSLEQRSDLALTRAASGDAAPAWSFASYGDSTANALFDLAYTRMVAALLVEGVPGARRELDAMGLADTSGPAPAQLAARAVGPGDPLVPVLAHTLAHPLDAAAHVALADGYRARGAQVAEAVELRIAFLLDPRRIEERLRLARMLASLGLVDAARRDLAVLVHAPPGAPGRSEAQRLLEHLGPAGAEPGAPEPAGEPAR